jgi:hypothetical protein
MGRVSYVRQGVSALALALAVLRLGVGPVWANPYTPPETRAMDPNGVDVGRSVLYRTETFLTIGDPSGGGLSWSYSGVRNQDGFTGYLHKDMAPAQSGGENYWTASMGEQSYTFYCDTCNSGTANYATLAHVGSTWTVTVKDGTVYTYDELTASSSYDYFAKLLSVQRPNGVRLNYTYGTCSGGNETCRLLSVVSNAGYAFKYDYDGSGYVSKVWGVNMTAHSCNATATTCDVYDNYINVGAGTITDALSNTTTIAADWVGVEPESFRMALLSYQAPGRAAMTAAYDYYGRMDTLTTASGSWKYTYSDNTLAKMQGSGVRTISLWEAGNNNNLVLKAHVNKSRAQLVYSVDPLNRETYYEYSSFTVPGSLTAAGWLPLRIYLPEGVNMNTTPATPTSAASQYGYDTRGNVTTVTRLPKPSSGLSSTAITAGYDTTCSNTKTCNQPNWTRDARNNQTDYTYNGTHGGVLTTTQPADQNGLRLRTYNTYTAFDTGNGYIYRLTRTESCALNSGQLALTACPASVSTSVTTTDYGNASTAPKTYRSFQPLSVTRTDGAGTLSVTTTYAYDNVGNLLSVDGPLAGTGDQAFKTYDANRRLVCEIGVDPDGGGALIRTMVRHSYAGDGRETLTQVGTGTSTTDCTPGSTMTVVNFKRMTYDTLGRLTKTEAGQP